MAYWWQKGIIYQIYPRSFQDSNGDGIGDLPGIIQRLDYLAWLGVDAIWISPFYPSPMADFGYDVSNYTDVHPMFGTLDDFDRLVEESHRRGLRVIIDFVPNHTSDQHPWFQESRSSRDNPKRDWYIWRDPAPDGGPPNNWLSRFGGGSAWEYDERTGQYYLHSFLKEQPDLNWRNPEVRAAMLDVLRFWLRRGVDGFRVDVSFRVMKDPLLRDNPPNPNWCEGMDPADRLIERYSMDFAPDIHQFNRWLRQTVEEFGKDKVLIGEMDLPFERMAAHYGKGDELHLPFNFRLLFSPWKADVVRQLIDEYERVLPAHAWPNWVLGNHDQPRIASRIGREQARVAAMFLLTVRGTPTMYYGDEIGMENVPIPPERVQDPWERLAPGFGRDPARTPMQWDDSPNAGFCPPGVEPWLPLAENYRTINVAAQRHDPTSMLTLTRALIGLRRAAPALNMGSIRTLDAPDGLLAYLREAPNERYLIVLNFTDQPQGALLPEAFSSANIVLSTYLDRNELVTNRELRLRPNEGIVAIV